MTLAKHNLLVVSLFSFFCLFLYFNSLRGIFIFDDAHSIVTNLYIKDIRHIPMFFKGYYTSDPDIPIGMFRPLLLLTFSFNYLFSGLQPMGYHIINILLHFLNGILFYYLLGFLFSGQTNSQKENLTQGLPVALGILISLLFLAHPLNTEAVTYISSRSDLLVYFLILSAFICYLKRRFWATLLLYALALLTKETALVLPILITAHIFTLHENEKNNPRIRIFLFFISIIGLSALYWSMRHVILSAIPKWNIPPPQGPWPNILTQSGVTLYYLRLFLWPHPLTAHHNFPILRSLSDPRAALSISAILFLIVLVFALRKKYPIISFGLGWYLICLIPKFYASLNIVASEHHFYLPSFGIYLIIAALGKNLFLKFRRKFMISTIGVICIFSVLVWFRNYEYKDEYTFWRSALRSDPSSPVAHYNVGMVYMNMGLYPEAERMLKKSLAYVPKNATKFLKDVRENTATIYRLQGKYEEALALFLNNIGLGFYNFGTYQNLGVLYQEMEDDENAEEAWRKGLSLNPKSSGILYNLAKLYARKKDFLRAKEYFRQAIDVNPDFFALYFGLGNVLEEEGNIDAAIKAYERAAGLKPNFHSIHYRLGTLYAQKSSPRALWHLKETVRLNSNFAEAHNNLAVLYSSMEPPQMKLSREHAEKALALGYKVNEDFLKIIGLEENKDGEEK
ncbi:tetratricopeptide repeat protein [bacterium]|nr:MAG: tetratricopeptide repeat protein [bacterium]